MDVDLSAVPGWLPPLAFIAAGAALGIFAETVVFRKIRKIAATAKWESARVTAAAFRGMPFFWFLLAGLYGASARADLGDEPSLLIEKTLSVLIILSLTVVAARIATGLVKLSSQRAGVVFLSASIFVNLTRIVVLAIGILTALQSIGVPITPLFTALGIGGLAVALGLQDTLSNLFAGIQVIASEQVRPGDYVKLESGDEGYVTDMSWRYTTIQSLPNNRVIVPNAKLASAIVTNYHLPDKELAVLVQVGVSYGSDLEEVERVTIEVARAVMREVAGGIPAFSPFIRYHTFGEFSVNFSVILRGREFVDQYLIKHEFLKRLHRRYREEGIEIPFPVRTVHLKQDSPPRPPGGDVSDER
ncbi:MAG: mechanosensitive ion channel family protein [bacterium]